MALAESLRRWSHPALVALVTPEVDALRPTLAHFYELVDVEHLSCLGLQGTEVRDAVALSQWRDTKCAEGKAHLQKANAEYERSVKARAEAGRRRDKAIIFLGEPKAWHEPLREKLDDFGPW